MSKIPVGLQLWTLRDELKKDLAGAIRRIGEIGYKGVELLPTDWPDVKTLKKLLTDSGLRMFSAHVPLARLKDDFAAVADYCRELGCGDIVVPSMPNPVYKDPAALRRCVDDIAAIARNCKAAGFRCSYHNHATEFQNTIDGSEVHDYIFATIGADLLKAQIDTYFVEFVGKNPAQFIRRFRGRVPLLHLKEKSNTPDVSNTEVGHGTIDWDAVFAAANEVGVEWYIVEQNCQGLPALESIKVSYDFLKAKGVA